MLKNRKAKDYSKKPIKKASALTFAEADVMTENCIGSVCLPLGICPYFVINGVSRIVPMATEEPSVVAACCAATKIIGENGGFTASSSPNIMTGQIALYDDALYGDDVDDGRIMIEKSGKILKTFEKSKTTINKAGTSEKITEKTQKILKKTAGQGKKIVVENKEKMDKKRKKE